MKDKLNEIPLLYDFYGQLLTPKQREYLELYYHHDLSLGEIGTEFSISRQAVYDILRRGEKLLEEYEAELGIVVRYQQERAKMAEALGYLQKLKEPSLADSSQEKLIQAVETIIKNLIEP